ncbi:glutamate/gamma-aminobutyrate family transporter YjeM [Dellaglioa algida]|uniref:Glutamate/gamma-aminobutyrate family transporter YjeM n=1 Tax=Dellaglioa carnosa TaxID=2995136 RepID=A0ABT4JL42_9LACO|nr:glutamate/gamma-aminobutyrate family transporter YjeM [Dellaglioa carnosa]MCZ2491000.1 glutamate/gamma-aminobutyrate family transporter YjeM [Dellaglioa carnosa]MCZ2494078.1 glutamate/gamma-aminobutyrate family transporter YjeM [Dellaglioa carnosa]MDK1730942.1 glutamate/gamma-aminobutyrate family transporter YjeM [Dellaglioa carnosa]TWW13768.1 glutamate/gamma-aminobutyrate family transporter YjeM [Dellaglioa algida]
MDKQKKISLTSFILMIFTTIFGFANTPVAFIQMGYASIIWYVLAAFFFFLPTALMFAEYGSALNESKGGIYSWLAESIGPKLAFMGTFIWLFSWIVWMVSIASKVWIPLSTIFAGSDQTQSWAIFGLSSTQTIGILAILWIVMVTFVASRGISSIAKISSIGGIAILGLNALFLILSVVILIVNHGALQEPWHGMTSIITSRNPSYQSPIALVSFIVFAIFAYGGMESVSGVTDSIKNPKKNFPKGLIVSTLLILFAYSISIFFWGVSTNWSKLGGQNANLGNISYVLMENLGNFAGQSFGMSASASTIFGHTLARITGLSMFMAYTGAFFVLIYSPLKSFILGTPKEIWTPRMTKLNKHNIPEFAMWVQAIVVIVIIMAVSFGGSNSTLFYSKLTLMGNISTSVPYLFLIGAFPFFKKRQDLNRPFEVYKNKTMTNIITIFVWLVLAFGIIFTVISDSLSNALWMVAGPVISGLVAFLYYSRYERKLKNK